MCKPKRAWLTLLYMSFSRRHNRVKLKKIDNFKICNTPSPNLSLARAG